MSTVPAPIVNRDQDIGTDATVTRGGELVGARRHRLAGGVITTTLAPWFVDSSVGGGSVVLTGGGAEIHSGTLAAPRGRVESFHRGRVIMPQTNHWVGVVSFNNVLTTGGRYRLGVWDDSDGYFYDILTGPSPSGRIVIRKAGVDTTISPPQGFKQPIAVDTSRHAYLIRYLITAVDFMQDGLLRHTQLSSTALPLIRNADLPIRIEAENLSAPGTDFVATFGNSSIVRIGEPADPAAAVMTDVATSTVSAQLVAANSMRRSAIIFNDSNRLLYLKFGSTASVTDFTTVVDTFKEYVIPASVYTGRIDGILNTGTGTARITITAEV